jgi:hypothetical protein
MNVRGMEKQIVSRVILAREVDGYSGLLKPLSFIIRRERLNPDQLRKEKRNEIQKLERLEVRTAGKGMC